MTFGIIILLILATFLLGGIAGLFVSVLLYPKWEIQKVKRHMKKEGIGYGEWKHVSKFVDHHTKVIVKPNCETLYSLAFIHKKDGPYKLTMPAFDTYFSFAFLDENTNVQGYFTNTDTIENKESSFLIYYDENEILDKSQACIILDSKLCWIIGRFGVGSLEDIPEVNKIQEAIRLVKLNH
ncbi:MAG: DUF1254 domain-containing protein [Bacteroidetes bacterium]|nr:DUF1254 domain-containing protein [Bacteroidota bacterium]